MRNVLILIGMSLAFGGCLDAHEGQEQGSVRFRLPADAGIQYCYTLEARAVAGDVWLERGVLGTTKGTAAEATAAGAICGTSVVEHVHACEPGEHVATASLAGAYTPTGDSLGGYVVTSAESAFTCTAGEETIVDFVNSLSIMRESQQGFFDIAVFADSEVEIVNACYAIRVETAEDGELLWEGRDICAARYGDGGTSVSYIGPCDGSFPAHKVKLWLVSFDYGPDVPLAERAVVNPCPAGTGEIATWQNACELDLTCLENRDVVVRYDLELSSSPR